MKSVLIIDDEQELIERLAIFLQRKGLKVFTANTGEAGLELYKEHDEPDCVFLDLHLPTMDGISVLKKIKEINPEAIVYFVTGDENAVLQKEGESLGAKGYILKPINIKNILNIIDTL